MARDEAVATPRTPCRPLRRLYGNVVPAAGILPESRGTSPVERKSRNNHTSKALDRRALSPFAVEDSFAAAARAAFAQPDTVQAMWRDVQKTPWREREKPPPSPAPAERREVQRATTREPISPRVSPRKNTSSTDLSLGVCQDQVDQKRITQELFSGGPRCKNCVPYNSRGKNSAVARTSKLRQDAPFAFHPGCGVQSDSSCRSRSLDADGRVAGVTRRARWSMRAKLESSAVDAPYSTEDQGGASTSYLDSPVLSRRQPQWTGASEGCADGSLLDSPISPRRNVQSQPQPVRRMVSDGGYGVRIDLFDRPAGAGASVPASPASPRRHMQPQTPVTVQRMVTAPAACGSPLGSPRGQYRHLEPAGKSALVLDAGMVSGSGIRCDKWSWAK